MPMDATLSTSTVSSAPAPPGAYEVARKRLLSKLASAGRGRAVLLRAPAGYGKSTLLAQWAAADPRPCAWVTACQDDDQGSLHAISAALDERAGPLVLVIDDAHLLRGADAAALLAPIAAGHVPDAQLALGARAEPALPLARLRTESRLLELGAPQLALDAHESALLLAHTCPELSAIDAASLAARAEGWPAALAIAARAMAEQVDPAAARAFSGADRLLAAYVREQILAELDAPARELLLRAAPLGALRGELCDDVLGRSGSGLLLRELAHGNVPLEPLDRAERRFRLHPLLAEALAAECARADAGWHAEAHRRASAWHDRRGDVVRAIDHAVAAGDAARAGALLWPALPAHAFGPASVRLDGWLRALGAAAVARTPALALGAALRGLARGQAGAAAQLATVAEQRPSADGAGSAMHAGAALVRAALARDGLARMRADARTARNALAGEPAWRALACLLAGIGAQLAGDAAGAQDLLDDATYPAAPPLDALRLAQLALLAFDQGRHQHAASLAARASRHATPTGDGRGPLPALTAAVGALAHAQIGALAPARAALDRSRRLATGAELPAWWEAELRFARARTLLRLSDAAGARAELTRMSRAVRQLPDAPVLQTWIEDGWARADAFAASAVRGPSRLTLAELRVLRLLPSHFSLREIAARLHVSANTVKTQAHAVYRKLDVSSRSEAVARAREIGLVDAIYR